MPWVEGEHTPPGCCQTAGGETRPQLAAQDSFLGVATRQLRCGAFSRAERGPWPRSRCRAAPHGRVTGICSGAEFEVTRLRAARGRALRSEFVCLPLWILSVEQSLQLVFLIKTISQRISGNCCPFPVCSTSRKKSTQLNRPIF